MTKIYRKLLLIFFLILSIAMLCFYFIRNKNIHLKKSQFYFTNNSNTDTIPFWFDIRGMMVTHVYTDNDTLNFIIDTGSSYSSIDSTYKKTNTTSQTFQKNSVNIIDAAGHTKKKRITSIKGIKWGNIKIKNEPALIDHSLYYQGTIGNHFLRNFYVKFDLQKNIIILSKKSDLILKKGEKIPFIYGGNAIFVQGILTNPLDKEINSVANFLFDTGYSGSCLSLEDSTYNSLKISKNKESNWVESTQSYYFPKGIYGIDSIKKYSFIDFKFGNKIFKNTIISNPSTGLKMNIIGTNFMSRFRSFSIDYKNKEIYFELPKDEQEGNMKFSATKIKEVPIFYLHTLYSHINSLGISVSLTNFPYTVNSLSLKYKNKIKIGDSLVGIDDNIFDKTVFNKYFDKKRGFKMINDSSSQKEIIIKILGKKNWVDFYFLKNKKLIKISTKRDTLLNPPPNIGYSFYYNPNKAMPYFYRVAVIKTGNEVLCLHYPWETLAKYQKKK